MTEKPRSERRSQGPEPARRRRDEQRREWERGQAPRHDLPPVSRVESDDSSDQENAR